MKSIEEIVKEVSPNGLTDLECEAIGTFLHFSRFPDMFTAMTCTRGSDVEIIVRNYLQQFKDAKEYRNVIYKLKTK